MDGESIRAPIRPFVIQDFDAFVRRLLSRPGAENALDRGTVLSVQSEMWDIKDGEAFSELKGLHGGLFMGELKRSELCLAWSLSVDWFNSFTNKAARTQASTGSIAMALNLPPSLRYKPDNLYLHGVIPGPRESSLEETNHFIRTLINQLHDTYEEGVSYSRAYEY